MLHPLQNRAAQNAAAALAKPIAAAAPAADEVEAKVAAKPAAPFAPIKPLTLEDIKKLAGGEVRAPKTPRLRFAPSPTGHLHIGGVRTALMNYLAAKNMGGEFLLRIEDTDHLRSKPEFTEAIKKGLEWLGLRWDGEVIFQSHRTELYQNKVKQLVDRGLAYKDGTGAVFFKMPEEGALVVNDRVKGRVSIHVGEQAGKADYVIQRSDGSPTFLFANVVDDGETGITHVIRGDDHLTNAARQIPLYRALGYDVPEFYHVPLIHGDDGAKLSKRHGAQSVIDYQQLGYDPVVVINHLARLGMRFGTDATLPVDELAKRFDPLGFSRSRSLLQKAKLDMRNLQQLRQMPLPELIAELKARTAGETVQVLLSDEKLGDEPNLLRSLTSDQLAALAEGVRSRAATLIHAITIGQSLLAPPVYTPELEKKHGTPAMKRLIAKLAAVLEQLPDEAWTVDGMKRALDAFAADHQLTHAGYGNALLWMLTGLSIGIPLPNTIVVLGKDEVSKRLAERTADAS